MASKNVAFGSLLSAVGIVAALAGCGGGTPTRPDAAGSPDAAVSDLDAFMVEGPDAGRDSGAARVCRSAMGNCDLLAQDCAPVMGAPQTCVYALPTMGATVAESVCAPIVDPGAEEGQPCCALNSCDVGMACVGATQDPANPGMCTAMGVCRRYCCGSGADCEPGQICNAFSAGFMGGICDTVDGCDLVRQTGCTSPESCYPSTGSATQCVRPTAAMAAEGATCEFTNDCVPGTACFTVTPGGGGTPMSMCLRFCDIGDGATDCPNSGGMACQAGGMLPAGTGICPPPA